MLKLANALDFSLKADDQDLGFASYPIKLSQVLDCHTKVLH